MTTASPLRRRSRGAAGVFDVLDALTHGLPVAPLRLEAAAARVARAGADALPEALRGAAERRYEMHVADSMVAVGAATFVMGTEQERRAHYCGETPARTVELSPYAIGVTPVTRGFLWEVFRLHGYAPGDETPATHITWAEAVLLAALVGCRLPTEAEWEFACGAGAAWDWCCEDERCLRDFGWYSENASGRARPVRQLAPNALGIHDMHGNVWEWCVDDYDEAFYARAPRKDPLSWVGGHRHVCRGGSVHALAEMCRTRYRQWEPRSYSAADIGFRLVRPVAS